MPRAPSAGPPACRRTCPRPGCVCRETVRTAIRTGMKSLLSSMRLMVLSSQAGLERQQIGPGLALRGRVSQEVGRVEHRQRGAPERFGPLPRSRMMPALAQGRRARRDCPSARSRRDPRRSTCRSRNGSIIAISSGVRIAVLRRPPGHHVGDVDGLVGVIAPSAQARWPPASGRASCPARPTKGTPCRSSSRPGASPMIITRASGSPSAKTRLRAPFFSSQRS